MSLLYVFIALLAYPVERGLFAVAVYLYKRWQSRRLQAKRRRRERWQPRPMALHPPTPKAMAFHSQLTKNRSNTGVLAPLNEPGLLKMEGATTVFSIDACLNMAKQTEERLRTATDKLQ